MVACECADGQMKSAQHIDRILRALLHPIDIAAGGVRLPHNVRWWSVVEALRPTKQGTPVQFRDGPAAVTESQDTESSSAEPTNLNAIVAADRKAPEATRRRVAQLGSQKTYQRVACSSPRGTETEQASWIQETLIAVPRRPQGASQRALNPRAR